MHHLAYMKLHSSREEGKTRRSLPSIFPSSGGGSGYTKAIHDTVQFYVFCLLFFSVSDITPKTKEISLDIYDYEKTVRGKSLVFLFLLFCDIDKSIFLPNSSCIFLLIFDFYLIQCPIYFIFNAFENEVTTKTKRIKANKLTENNFSVKRPIVIILLVNKCDKIL